MRKPPRPQDDDRNNVDEHRNNNDGNNDDDHRGAVETNAGESNSANEIKGVYIEEEYDIEER